MVTGACVEIENSRRIKRVAVEANDGLMIDGCRFAAVLEFSKAALLFEVGGVEVGLCANEIIDVTCH